LRFKTYDELNAWLMDKSIAYATVRRSRPGSGNVGMGRMSDVTAGYQLYAWRIPGYLESADFSIVQKETAMKICCWTFSHGRDSDRLKEDLIGRLQTAGVEAAELSGSETRRLGLGIATEISPTLHQLLQATRATGSKEIIVIMGPKMAIKAEDTWGLLRSGASDVLLWTDSDGVVQDVMARFQRWMGLETLLTSSISGDIVVGTSSTWRAALVQVVEIARFSNSAALIMGETGTGKEVAARLIHDMDGRANKRDLVVQDCSTLVAELSGSELFGHERGAFTGAHTGRQGAFALAHGGTLFLDEIGELPLPIQAQLLRAIQEGTYKRVGGTTWQRTHFRLVCATNKDLEAMVSRGEFRADLYHRIAGHVCRLPPLRERLEDVLPLATHFIGQMQPGGHVPTLDPMVRDYLLRRKYPGNVRELKQVVGRLMHRYAGGSAISIGYVPLEERPASPDIPRDWFDAGFESIIQRAVVMGAGLKEIGRAAEDCAIRCATAAENGSLKRAALRLGVTDRALQLRRAQVRGEEVLCATNGKAPRH
jgi:DNA-binding NtrC family response regulator